MIFSQGMSRVMTNGRVSDAVEKAARSLISVHHFGHSSSLNLPLLYPDGSAVTLKIDPVGGNGTRVSDGGLSYRELEAIGAETSFPNTAQTVADEMGLLTNRRLIYVDTDTDGLFRAICDVAVASWRVVDTIYRRVASREETDIEDVLRERLVHIFGQKRVLKHGQKIVGASSSDWEVSAVVRTNGHDAIFQAVGAHPNSIYRATSAFHDLAALAKPPTLVAVVRDKNALGPRLGLLSQVGKVIEDRQPDSTFQRAAAA
jgi:hypothetical protein